MGSRCFLSGFGLWVWWVDYASSQAVADTAVGLAMKDGTMIRSGGVGCIFLIFFPSRNAMAPLHLKGDSMLSRPPSEFFAWYAQKELIEVSS